MIVIPGLLYCIGLVIAFTIVGVYQLTSSEPVEPVIPTATPVEPSATPTPTPIDPTKTVFFDTFTSPGPALVPLASHTPEVGTWEIVPPALGFSGELEIVGTSNYCRAPAGNNEAYGNSITMSSEYDQLLDVLRFEFTLEVPDYGLNTGNIVFSIYLGDLSNLVTPDAIYLAFDVNATANTFAINVASLLDGAGSLIGTYSSPTPPPFGQPLALIIDCYPGGLVRLFYENVEVITGMSTAIPNLLSMRTIVPFMQYNTGLFSIQLDDFLISATPESALPRIASPTDTSRTTLTKSTLPSSSFKLIPNLPLNIDTNIPFTGSTIFD
jgi:hypothetical protein